MDFARKFWMSLLLKPEEFNYGYYAVKLRVSYVSIPVNFLFVGLFCLFTLNMHLERKLLFVDF